jgi:RNA polymerase sigma-70 factor (ECF subfamily)
MYWARDEQAIAQTKMKYGAMLRALAYHILHNREDSEECENDTYLGAWNAIPPARPQNLTAFVAKIARNLSLKRLEYLTRDKRSANMTVSFCELEEILPDSVAESVGDERLGALMSEFLRTQKSEVRQVFVRKYYFFDTVEDIAKRYSFSESKVKSILYHTRKRLKEYLSREGIDV